MTVKDQLLQEIDLVPDALLEEVLDFIDLVPDALLEEVLDFIVFLKHRHSNGKAENASIQKALNHQPLPHQRPSTGDTILETLDRIGTWEGDDLHECLEMVACLQTDIGTVGRDFTRMREVRTFP